MSDLRLVPPDRDELDWDATTFPFRCVDSPPADPVLTGPVDLDTALDVVERQMDELELLAGPFRMPPDVDPPPRAA